MSLVLIAAVAEDRTIGKDGNIPWKIPEDLTRFKNLTLGHSIILGRGTFESIGSKPLKKRDNIVVSSKENLGVDGIIVVNSVREALNLTAEEKTTYVIGGQSIYEATIDLADKLEITKVIGNYKGDRFFPEINLDDWALVDSRDRFFYRFCTYERRN